MKPFIILGGDSRLARAFVRIYGAKADLVKKSECDITSSREIEKILKTHSGKYVLNCAALTDVELCEKNPKKCLEINTVGPYLLGEACEKRGRKLIHISSDYALHPTTTYGWSKYLSEKFLESHLVVRTNFYDEQTYIIKQILERKNFSAFTNMTFNPISVNKLVHSIWILKNQSGIFNVFSNKKISYLTFAENARRVLGADEVVINPSLYKHAPDKAIRPLTSYVRSDINENIIKDLGEFKEYINENK